MSRARENVDKLRDGDFTGIDMEADSIDLINSISAPLGTIDVVRLENADDPDPLRLDWYQEGDWTPTLFFSGVNNAATYTQQIGRFSRIGRTCHLYGAISFSGVGGSTGNILISGLPFNAATRAVGAVFWSGVTVGGSMIAYVNPPSSSERIGLFDNSGTNSVEISVGDLLLPSSIVFYVTYEVAV